MNTSVATREVFWNVSQVWVMYVLLVPTLFIAAYGVMRRAGRWRRGRPAARFDQPVERLKRLFQQAIVQRRTLADPFAGTFHLMIFWGMVTLTVATTVVLIEHDFGLPVMRGRFYLYFQSLFVDVLGFLALVGIALAGGRRWWKKPQRLVYTGEASMILLVLAVILLSGFVLEGLRIAATDDPFGAWSPIGFLVADISRAVAETETLQTAHVWTWWFHMALVFGLIAWAPYTKLLHLLTAPLNVYTANLRQPGASLKTIDFEADAPLGVHRLEDFTWKDLLDLDACTECGRCTNQCPAHSVGKSLSPRDLILDLRRLLHGDLPPGMSPAKSNSPRAAGTPLVGATPALAADVLWECTTCGACVEACPVEIEQLPKIVDLRRYQVMEEAALPGALQEATESLDSRGHPFRGAAFSRLDWTEGLDIPLAADGGSFDVLLWVGCGGALIERNHRVTRAVAKLLKRAGVNFAILGREEKCTGDPARRIGHEFLFESLAQENISTLARHGVKHIVTPCPHCFNAFRHEYGRLDGCFEVHHHSQYLQALVTDGKLPHAALQGSRVTYHDPCYLGRHNGEYDAPRRLVESATGSPPVEIRENRGQSFCCGGGGGMSFIDEAPDKRVNQRRAAQVRDTGAEVLAVACPFCMTMMEDGLRSIEQQPATRVMDVAEILWEAVLREGDADNSTTTVPESPT